MYPLFVYRDTLDERQVRFHSIPSSYLAVGHEESINTRETIAHVYVHNTYRFAASDRPRLSPLDGFAIIRPQHIEQRLSEYTIERHIAVRQLRVVFDSGLEVSLPVFGSLLDDSDIRWMDNRERVRLLLSYLAAYGGQHVPLRDDYYHGEAHALGRIQQYVGVAMQDTLAYRCANMFVSLMYRHLPRGIEVESVIRGLLALAFSRLGDGYVDMRLRYIEDNLAAFAQTVCLARAGAQSQFVGGAVPVHAALTAPMAIAVGADQRIEDACFASANAIRDLLVNGLGARNPETIRDIQPRRMPVPHVDTPTGRRGQPMQMGLSDNAVRIIDELHATPLRHAGVRAHDAADAFAALAYSLSAVPPRAAETSPPPEVYNTPKEPTRLDAAARRLSTIQRTAGDITAAATSKRLKGGRNVKTNTRKK